MAKIIHIFSERLLKFVESTHMTKTAFASSLNLSPQAFNTGYIRKKPFPGSHFFLGLVVMGCDIRWLLTGEGRPPEPMNKEDRLKWIQYCKNQAEQHEHLLIVHDLMVKELAAAPVNMEKQKIAIEKEEIRRAATSAVTYKSTKKRKGK